MIVALLPHSAILPLWMLTLRPQLVRLALRVLHDPLDAEDAVQDLYLSLLRRPPRDMTEAACYLFGAVRHHALNLLRRRVRQKADVRREVSLDRLPECGPTPVDRGATPAAAAEANDLIEVAYTLAGTFRPRLRDAWRLRASGCSYEEIARVLGTTEDTVKTRVYQARKALRRALL